MAWKVLITAAGVMKGSGRTQELLRAAGGDVIVPPRFGPLKAADISAALTGVDAVLASLDEYSSVVLSSPAAAQLQVISRWGVGYDSVDVTAATQNGIVVTYTPGLLDDAVADYTFALLLSLARRVTPAHDGVSRGQWSGFLGDDVAGKTLGLIGFGRIGRAVARRAVGFNQRVLVYAPRMPADADKCGVEFVSLDALLAGSDFVSLHAALTPQNQGMLGEAQLRRMKKTAYLINTARGALVDEAALVRALREEWIAGAALDAFVTEPLRADDPLRTAPNVLLSPHQASFGRDTSELVSLAAGQAIADVMNGRRPQNILNPEVLKSPVLRARLRVG